jgi:rSAM/selenodomain-associated transferase 1
MSSPNIEILIPVLASEEKLLPLLIFLSNWDFKISVAIGHADSQPTGKEVSAEEAIALMPNLLSCFPDSNSPNGIPNVIAKVLPRIRWAVTFPNRAFQLNYIAQLSQADFFWFLHADSTLEGDFQEKIILFANSFPQSIGYGKLKFANDGPWLCFLNAYAANLRSRFLGMPFEDQSFFMSKTIFTELGGFLKHLPYGEGHDLIWRAKRAGIKLVPLHTTITTSARRYKAAGWIKTTARFVYLTYKQAIPHFVRNHLKEKCRRQVSFNQTRFNQSDASGAIAVFVKTPGLSPMKTRLARSLGTQNAETFQLLAIEEIKGTLAQCPEITQYWAVSEADGLFFEEWKNLKILLQGEGDLGDKIHRIYSMLQSKYGKAIIVGSDTPQITARHIKETLESLEKVDYVIGPARDGGFWLFAGTKPISLEIWQSVRWSHAQTLRDLMQHLKGSFFSLETLTDVDQIQDISAMLQEATTLRPQFLLFLENLDIKVIS